MDARGSPGGCSGLISFGVAGGLAPQLDPGACIVGSAILSGTARMPTDPTWSKKLLQTVPGAIHGTLVGVPAPIAHPDAKRALYIKTGAMAVDMESHIVGAVAKAHGIPFAAICVITDPAVRACRGRRSPRCGRTAPPRRHAALRPGAAARRAGAVAHRARRARRPQHAVARTPTPRPPARPTGIAGSLNYRIGLSPQLVLRALVREDFWPAQRLPASVRSRESGNPVCVALGPCFRGDERGGAESI